MTKTSKTRQSGFTLIELLIAVLVLMIIMGTAFRAVALLQQRSGSEDVKMDLTQEARESMDQFTRELHNSGYPSLQNFDPSNASVTANTWTTSSSVAVRLVQITPSSIIFEGDVDDSGQVSSVRYTYVATSDQSNRCPCIVRSQVAKAANVAPLSQGVNNRVLVEDVVTNGFTLSAFDQNGNAVAIPSGGLDVVNNTALLTGTPSPAQAVIKSIGAVLSLQANAADMASKQKPAYTVTAIVELKN